MRDEPDDAFGSAFALHKLAKRLIAPGTPYVRLDDKQVLALSTVYQAGVVSWIAFWAVYRAGFGAANLTAIGTFGVAYMAVVLIEPLADRAVLAAAKSRKVHSLTFVTPRLYSAALALRRHFC